MYIRVATVTSTYLELSDAGWQEGGGREGGDRDEEGKRRKRRCEAVVLCTTSPLTTEVKIKSLNYVPVIK